MSYKHYNNGPGIFSMNDVYFSHLIDSAGPDAGGGGLVLQCDGVDVISATAAMTRRRRWQWWQR